MMKNRGLCIVLSMISMATNAETVRCGVGFILSPTVEDIAVAYDKSDNTNLLYVSDDLRKKFCEIGKKYSVKSKAMVELQSLPKYKTLRKAKVDEGGKCAIEIKDDEPDCRLFCSFEIGGKVLTGVASIDWDAVSKGLCQYMQLRTDYNVAMGRCLGPNGAPISNAIVEVRHIRTPTEQDESWFGRIRRALTDDNGYWRVDGIETPSIERLLSRISNTNVVDRYDSRVPPYGIQVGAVLYSDKGIDAAGGVTIPNVTARDRAAAERIFAAYKRKTGKDWPRPAPMTDFPVSTNNVIYVPNIVLK